MEIGTRDIGIATNGKDYITLDGLYLEGATDGNVEITANSDYTVIQNCTMKNAGWYNVWGRSTNTYITVSNNTLSYTHRESVMTDGTNNSNWTIDNNDIGYAGWWICEENKGNGIFCNAASSIIEHNEIHHNGVMNNNASVGYDHGIYLGATATGVIVRYNNVHDNTRGVGIQDNGADNVEIYYNLSHLNAYGILAASATGVKINNNVVYKNEYVPGKTGGYGIDVLANTTIAELKNNIIFANQDGAATYSRQIYLINASTSVLTASDNNIIYGSGSGDVCMVVATGKTFTEWQGLGYDANSQHVDPDMINEAGGNFSLNSTSPCIDNGTDVSLALDYAGSFVPCNTTPDIGAFEYIDMKPDAQTVTASIPGPTLGIGINITATAVQSITVSAPGATVTAEQNLAPVITGGAMGMGMSMGM